MEATKNMLITCPECGLPASDKALACPHCGYPLKDQPKEYKRKPKRKRLPNGFGQISEIKNRNLARPFRACVTVGYNEQGRPITKNLKPCAYFETYNEAYAALVKYAASPYDLTKRTTVQELYDAWSPKKFESLGSQSRINQIRSAWTHEPIRRAGVRHPPAPHQAVHRPLQYRERKIQCKNPAEHAAGLRRGI